MNDCAQETPHSGFVNVSPKKLYRLKAPAGEPVRIRDSRAIFELTKALKSADKALVVWTLRGWVAHNQAKKKGYRDGHHWTFNSLDKWQAKHFPWLSVKQLSTLMAQLVKQGVVVRTRRNVHSCYWYRVNESVLATLCTSIPSANSLTSQTGGQSDKTAERSDKTADQSSQMAEHKTTVVKQENQKQKNSKTQTTTAPQTDVAVVVPHPAPARNEESGEHSINGEMLHTTQDPDAHGEPALIEAKANAQERTAAPIPHSADPLSPLALDLISISIVPSDTARLVAEYGEGRVREVFDHTMRQSSVHTPAGFMIDLLRRRVDVSVVANTVKPNQTSPQSPPMRDSLTAAWDAHLREQNARMLAEDAASDLMNELVHEPSDPNLEYA